MSEQPQTHAEEVLRPHGLVPMRGRSQREDHRVSSPLELLYDLTIVVAFSSAGSLFSDAIVAGHVLQGLAGFGFALFAVIWAWLSFTWFSSAYDNDDWGMRVATLLQMIGVLVLTLGLPRMFDGMEQWRITNQVMVAGYVLMRISMISLWVRAARSDADRRPVLLRYAGALLVIQVCWVLAAFTHLPRAASFIALFILGVAEMLAPRMIETASTLTPWHPHHIAERYSLLMIITLGEVVMGTTIAVQAVVQEQGWTLNAALVVLAGASIAFGLWWLYFIVPFAQVLERRRDRGWVFGIGHIPLFAATAAIGAALHVAASYVEGRSALSETRTVMVLAVAMVALVGVFYAIVVRMIPSRDPLHLLLLVLTVVSAGAALLLARAGVAVGWCLLVLAVAPWVSVIGYETRGHDHMREFLARVQPTDPTQE